MTLLEHLEALPDQPELWPVVLQQMRFLEPTAFQAVWLVLMLQITLQASKRAKLTAHLQLREELWRLAENKLGPVYPSPDNPPMIPMSLVIWVLGAYLETWGHLDYWEGWLRSYFLPDQVLKQLSMMLPFLPGWQDSTRQQMLILAMRFLEPHPEPHPEPEQHLELLGDLAESARQIGQNTQAELLLDEMPVLLKQTGEDRPYLAFSLAMQWISHGQARQARFALKIWRQSFNKMSGPDQLWEVERVLSDLSTRFWMLKEPLSLEAFSLLQGWIQDLSNWVSKRSPVYKRRKLLLDLIEIGQHLQLPDSADWLAALGLDNLPPVLQAVALGYARSLHAETGLSEAYEFSEGLPRWLRRLSNEAARPLQLANWHLPEELARYNLHQLLELKTATLLLKNSLKKPHRGHRQRLLKWGFSLLTDLLPSSLNQLQSDIQQHLQEAQSSLTAANREEAEQLDSALICAQNFAHHLALRHQLLEYAGDAFSDWAEAVLALASAEINREQLQSLQQLVQSLPSNSVRWQFNLSLAQGLMTHQAWTDVKPLWDKLFQDWNSLDEEYDQLRGLTALGLSLAKTPLPDSQSWFERLYRLAESLDPVWRNSALAAVGHCQIRCDLNAGLAGIARIQAPAEKLKAVLQVSSVLADMRSQNQALKSVKIKPPPALLKTLKATTQAQTDPASAWQGHVALSQLYWLEQKPQLALNTLRTGLKPLLDSF